MYKVFKSYVNGTNFYRYRKMNGKANAHIVHIGNGIYIDKNIPEVPPMIEMSDGFASDSDAMVAIDRYIEIDTLRGIPAVKATAQTPTPKVTEILA